MQKKIIIQIALLLLAILIILVTFNIYFSSDINQISNDDKNDKKTLSKNKDSNNLIKDIYYVSKDKAGNVYEIMSKIGEIDSKNPSIIHMTDVTAKLLFTDFTPVNITSKYAKYNNETYDTNFYKDILVQYLDHNVRAENMNLSTKKNLVTLDENIFYDNSNLELLADKVEIDLLTKNSKIFMDDKYKKVEIIGTKKNGNN
jgi:hypothetical protein